MFQVMNSHAACRAFVAVAAAFALAVAPASSGQDPTPQGPRGQERRQPQGEENRADPCAHEPQGNAYGRDRRCPPIGGSGGIGKGDFNGDGYGDLAIGVPYEDVGSITDAGAVNVLYGSFYGLLTTAGPDDQIWDQDSAGIEGTANAYDRFGSSLASGDFNGDGYSDLAVGVPGEDVVNSSGTTILNAGAVNVIYGSPDGLSAAAGPGDQFWTQGRTGVDTSETADSFGWSLVWGQFNRDNFGDLVVGVPYENIGSIEDAGAVHVLHGSMNGLASFNSRFMHLNNLSPSTSAEAGDHFGASLAAGSRYLAVGAPDKDTGDFNNTRAIDAGEVYLLGPYYPEDEPLTYRESLSLDQAYAHFGFSLAIGPFIKDWYGLAVGVPYLDHPGSGSGIIRDGGAVYFKSIVTNARITYPNDCAFKYTYNCAALTSGDLFGYSLAAGDFDGDGQQELAVGAPFMEAGDAVAGQVHILKFIGGLEYDLRPKLWQLLFQSRGIEGTPEAGDNFGMSLSAWNFGNGSQTDLAIGVPGEDLGSIQNAGMVHVLYGSPNSLLTGGEVWHQDIPNVEGAAEPGDYFGLALY